MDWEGYEVWEMEKTEDSNVVLLPIATTDTGRRKFFVREPREKRDGMFSNDMRILPDLDLFWSSGIQVYTNNILIPARVIEILSNKVKTWPLVFYASQNTGIPAPAGAMTIRLERKPTKNDVNGEITFDEIKCQALCFKIKYPCDTNGNGLIDDPGNEFAFNVDYPATLKIVCVAEACVGIDTDKLRWRIEDVGAIRGEWSPHIANDVHIGKGTSPTVTFTGMPMHNSDFGPKNITLGYDGLFYNDEEIMACARRYSVGVHPASWWNRRLK